MPLVADIAEWQRTIDSLTVLAMRDVNSFWRQISLLDPVEARSVLMEVMPEVVRDYASAAGSISADFYSDSGTRGFRAIAAEPPPIAQVQGSVGWATVPLFSGDGDTLNRLAGLSRRLIFTTSRETTLLNASRENGATWARFASANACPFCRMLATRDDVYSSERTAKASHDHCKCMAVPVRPGETYKRPPYVNEWQDQYLEARKSSGSGDPKDILSAWGKALRSD